MLKTFIISSALAIFAFAQDANAQKPKPRPPKPRAETTTLGDISALAALKSNSGQTACEISSFVLYIERAGLDPVEINYSGNEKEFDKTMKSTQKGDRLTFTKIKGKCKGEAKEQELTDVVIEVK